MAPVSGFEWHILCILATESIVVLPGAGRKENEIGMAKTLGDITGELTEKVLGPAKAEAERVVAEARQEAERIVAAARQEADRARETAKQDVEALKRQMDVDMETAARNFMIMLEERIEGAVVAPVIDEAFKPLLSDREFLEKMILELMKEYGRHVGKENHIEVLLPAARKAELEPWFMEKFHGRMSNPMEVRFSDKMTFGFKIGVANRGSHVNFGDGLLQSFAEFCSPRFRRYFIARKDA